MNRIKLTFKYLFEGNLSEAWKMLNHRCADNCTEHDHLGYCFNECNVCHLNWSN